MKKLKTYNLLMLELFGLTNHGVDILSVMKWHLKMIVGFVLKTGPVDVQNIFVLFPMLKKNSFELFDKSWCGHRTYTC